MLRYVQPKQKLLNFKENVVYTVNWELYGLGTQTAQPIYSLLIKPADKACHF